MLQWEKPWVKIHRVAQFVALLNGVWAVLHRPQRLPTGADPPPSPPLVHGAGLRHSARQETACRCSRSRAVISSEPCGCVTAFHYQFMHRQFFLFFCMEVSRAVAATLMVLGKRGLHASLSQAASRLEFPGPWLTMMVRIVCRGFFFMANSVLCCRWQQQSLGGYYFLPLFSNSGKETHIKIYLSICFWAQTCADWKLSLTLIPLN